MTKQEHQAQNVFVMTASGAYSLKEYANCTYIQSCMEFGAGSWPVNSRGMDEPFNSDEVERHLNWAMKKHGAEVSMWVHEELYRVMIKQNGVALAKRYHPSRPQATMDALEQFYRNLNP